MSKVGFALSSLVAVIPAAFMLYLLIMGMMGGLSGMLMIMTGVGILAGVGVVALPILGFIMGPKSPSAPKKDKQKKSAEDEIEDFDDEEMIDDADAFEEVDEDVTEFGDDDLSEETMIAESDDEWDDSEFEDMEFDEDDLKDA